MTILENLYFGNINPCDSKPLKANQYYNESLSFVVKLRQRIINTLNAEQQEMFERYILASDDLTTVITEDAFKSGFSLAMKIMIESNNYNACEWE